MKVFNNLKELEDAPFPIYVYIRKNINNNASLAVIRDQMRRFHFTEDQVFDYYLGGKPCIIETYDDLSHLNLWEENPETEEWYTILEKPGDFDVIDEFHEGWIAFVIISNNSGGNTYFVPTWMKDLCPNIQKSIDITNNPDTSFEHTNEDN